VLLNECVVATCNNFAASDVLARRGAEVGRVMRAAVDDPQARELFQTLAREHLACLYGLARRLTRHDPEDLVQDALLRGYRSHGTLRNADAGCGWLRAILINTYRDQLRRDARSVDEIAIDDIETFSLYRTLAEEDPFPYSDSLHLDFLHAFGREDVREVLLRLPNIYRAPLVLRYVQGYATKEIARLLATPVGTVLAQLHRGRKLFERELWTYAEENGLLIDRRVQ
jgi:RNA polymerase sigma-70 factor, ECF subfamily